ncbi:hypothetical protein BC828DRAFT_418530 [Blastocladiella britannica]|nr:hypothetical protein BC828DRAFT_418530 [Blastocladiella britannica]
MPRFPLFDLPDTVLRALHWHLDVHSVLLLRQTSKAAAWSDVVLGDRMLAAMLALISGNEAEFLCHAPKFRPADVQEKIPSAMDELDAFPASGRLLFYRLACVLVRMDAPRSRWVILRRWAFGHSALAPKHYRTLLSLVAEDGAADSLDVLLAWKSRKGCSMYRLSGSESINLLVALDHPRIAGRPDIAEWVLQRLDVFLQHGARPDQLLRSLRTKATVFLKVLARLLPVMTKSGAEAINALSVRPDEPSSYTNIAHSAGTEVLFDVFWGVVPVMEPIPVFRAILAALLIAHHYWRPSHVLASTTAFRLDFGTTMTPDQGLAALGALLIQCTGGDAALAGALEDGFAQISPEAARNGLLLFSFACMTDLSAPNLSLVVSAVSIDPPEFSSLLEHEICRAAVGSIQKTIVAQHFTVPPREHVGYAMRSPPSSSQPYDPVAIAQGCCRGCEQALPPSTSKDDARRQWGVVVSVPNFLGYCSS